MAEPKKDPPTLAASFNWAGIAAFLGRSVDEVRSLPLKPLGSATPSGEAARSSGPPGESTSDHG